MKNLLFVLALASTAIAHSSFSVLHINGVDHSECLYVPPSTDPITDLSSSDMACGAPGTKPSSLCTVPAGASVSLEWRIDTRIPPAEYELKSDGSKQGVIDISHKGPCAVYMKKVDDPLSTMGAGSGWFKIKQDTLDGSGVFCTDRLRLNDAPFPVTIPKTLPPGKYLLRGELLTLNNAGPASLGGEEEPQFYVGCTAIVVTGSGSGSAPVVAIPGYVSKSTPGLIFDIWSVADNGGMTYSNYPSFGPAAFVDSSSGGGNAAPTTKTQAPVAPTTKAPVAVEPKTPTATAPATSSKKAGNYKPKTKTIWVTAPDAVETVIKTKTVYVMPTGKAINPIKVHGRNRHLDAHKRHHI